MTAETWMPVTGTFRTYPLAPVLWHWEDGPLIWTKGHHDPLAFLAAAIQEWAEESDDSLTIYGGGGWEQAEGPLWPPRRLRDVSAVRQEWWANRMHAMLVDEGYSYFVEPGPCWRRGAYPVTVVEL